MKRLIFILMAICVLLSACGKSGTGSTGVSVIEAVKEYETMSYGDFQEKTGKEAEFYHGTYFMGEIPNSSVCVVYNGEYDEDVEAAVLKGDNMPFRMEGSLSDLMTGIKEEMSLTELTKALSKSGKVEAKFEVLEDGGTAYYVGNKYALIQFDSDKSGEYDRLLLLSLDDSAGETVGLKTYAWLERL